MRSPPPTYCWAVKARWATGSAQPHSHVLMFLCQWNGKEHGTWFACFKLSRDVTTCSLTLVCPTCYVTYRKAVRRAQLVACPWRGYDPAPSPTGPTSTPQPLAPLPLPPPPHIAKPSAVPPPTTGSDDTVTSVSLFSNFHILDIQIFEQIGLVILSVIEVIALFFVFTP